MNLRKLSEQDIRLIIRDEIAKIFSVNNSSGINWVNAKEAARQLGYHSDVRALYYLKDSGVLRVGKEIQDRRPSKSNKGVYFFNISACVKRLNILPEKRN